MKTALRVEITHGDNIDPQSVVGDLMGLIIDASSFELSDLNIEYVDVKLVEEE